MPTMWVIVHAFSGLALGVAAPLGIALLVPTALLLHLLLDLVPHWDYTRDRRRAWWAALDVTVAAAVVAAAVAVLDLSSRAVIAAVVSALPDLDVLDALFPGPAHRRLFPSHWARFPHGECGLGPGIASQVCVVLISLATILALSL
jgi:hypothetical protein